MVEILAELFSKTSNNEIDKLCYLLQGRVVSLFDSVEFGMADKTVIEALVRSLNTNSNKIQSLFKEKGDLGTVAEELRTKSPKQSELLSINEVYSKLLAIAKTTGSGSVDKKVNLLADLVSKLDSLSVRYVVRIPLDKLRLGFSDMTILDSLAWMIAKSKKDRPHKEKAYNVRPDLGLIARLIKEKGLPGLNEIKPDVGIPILMAKADRLSSSQEILDKIGKCAIESKYDGLRLQVHYDKNADVASEEEQVSLFIHQREKGLVRMFSRNLENMTLMFPDIEEAVRKQIKADKVIFEGEVVAYNPKTGVSIPFQQTMQRKRKYNIAEKAHEIPVKLYCYELLYSDGKNYISEHYLKRKEELRKIISNGEVIKYAQEEITDNAGRIEELFNRSIKEGYEGIIAKRLTGAYQAGMRGWNWIKFKKAMSKKLMDTFDVLVMGYTRGEGKRTDFGVGQFLTGIYDQKRDKFVT
ncbi:MAG: DNA ligase, partial [Acidobacteria bacterium]|nr:DNA ligase [Acidobacteriota bacterium]